ncbi:site-specific DNA-methyltransferase, partial [Candidatus Bathyarchaeota archaeon]|nr:site-specific DNA-methyltransferase [Candidatus Bathyarchaeota archaeon]
EVDTVSLHVHERIDPLTIIEAVRKRELQEQQSLFHWFETKENNPPITEAIEFYKHSQGWSNRLIAGDSLLVMNSLLEKEGMAGKVQMIYIDPPYGIKYGSNFQPFINKRDVRDGKDEDLTQEPEMIKAFRDTWELGIHSYLTYLRNRLLLAKDLLHESGSCFVQISDENVHHVKELMDEIFGIQNYISLITIKRSSVMFSKKFLNNATFYVIWYAKDANVMKYRHLYKERDYEFMVESAGSHLRIESPNGSISRALSYEERANINKTMEKLKGYKLYGLIPLSAQGTEKREPFEFQGKKYYPPEGAQWKTSYKGLETLKRKNRIESEKSTLRYKVYFEDYPVIATNSLWEEIGPASDKIYVVQTPTEIIKRCMLMSSDPGDLVFDPTCGSGTTGYVAEQWGRRWITCDTSRVSITLAKQRLMTAVYDYYELAHPKEGVSSGFNYEKVPHVTLGSVANDEPPEEETLYNRPIIDRSKKRVAGPFTTEAVPSQIVRSLEEVENSAQEADVSIARSGETLRQNDWIAELLSTGIRGKSGQTLEFVRIEPLGGTRWIHAEAEAKDGKKAVISFGPEYAPLEQRQVELAIEETQALVPKPKLIIFASFQFDPEAAKDLDELRWPGVDVLKVQMNTDLLTLDLKKKRASNESFWLIGQPDVEVKKQGNKYVVAVNGFDYYNTKTGEIESGDSSKIALWELDTDYDGRSIYPRQVFFPMSGSDEGWSKLAKNLKAQIDEELIENYRGNISLPFKLGNNKQIAVKIIDDRGIESLKILRVRE